MILIRCWGLDLALAAAVVLGIVGAIYWHDVATLPRIPLGVPMPDLFPVLTTILLTWPLVERWPEQRATSARPSWQVPLLRFAATQSVVALSAVIASGGGDAGTLARCSIGASVASLLTPSLGRASALVSMVLGYAWLTVSLRSDLSLPRHGTTAAMIALAGCGAAYLTSEVRRAP